MADAPQIRRSKSLGLSLRNIYETLAVCLPTVVQAASGHLTKEVCDQRLAHWGRRLVENARVKLEVVGRENMVRAAPDLGSTFLVMSNHQSLYDVPVLFCAIGANLRMITKAELFRVPVFGGAMEHSGFIAIDRSNRKRAMRSLEDAKRTLAGGTHVWIAPEGTRSKTGELLPFKKGGFSLAMDAKLPILPVTLRGTRDILESKGVRTIPDAHVRVSIHPPFDPRPYTASGRGGRERLMAEVRAAIESGL